MSWEVDARSPEATERDRRARCQDPRTKLILATDPDREGEAISWHVLEFLKQ